MDGSIEEGKGSKIMQGLSTRQCVWHVVCVTKSTHSFFLFIRFLHIRGKGRISGFGCRICAWFSLKVRVRLKGVSVDWGVGMTEGGESFFSPGAPVPIFVVGDM